MKIVFVQMENHICQNQKMHFSKSRNVFIQIEIAFVQITDCVCLDYILQLYKLQTAFVQTGIFFSLNWKLYVFKLKIAFVQNSNYICPDNRLYVSKLQIARLQITNCICPNWKLYLFKLKNVLAHITDWICQKQILTQITFGKITIFMCPKHRLHWFNQKLHVSKLQRVFVQIAIVKIEICFCPKDTRKYHQDIMYVRVYHASLTGIWFLFLSKFKMV